MSFAPPFNFHPTNFGYTPTGSAKGSQVIIGGSPSLPWEGIGLGQHGRPDPTHNVLINLTTTSGQIAGTTSYGASYPAVSAGLFGVMNVNVDDLMAIVKSRPNAPSQFNFVLKEVFVCVGGVTKAMAILASQTYSTGVAP